jgi:hypothetical protein
VVPKINIANEVPFPVGLRIRIVKNIRQAFPKSKQHKPQSHAVRAVFQVRVPRWRSNTDLFAIMSWASARCDEMGSQYPGNGAMVDSRLVFGPSNPNALVR